MTTYEISFDRSSLPDFSKAPEKIAAAIRMGINRTADRTRTAAADAIRGQVNFPAQYLRPGEKRLWVRKQATTNDLEAVITSRTRATSLARFAKQKSNTKDVMTNGLTIEVKTGKSKRMKGTFFVKLRAGANVDTQSNLGVAIYMRNGQKPNRAYMPVELKRSKSTRGAAWLLYGPSVYQVFDTVRSDIAPDATDFLETEVTRILNAGIL